MTAIEERVCALYKMGNSYDRIRWQTGLTQPRIKKILVSNNVPIRPSGPVPRGMKNRTPGQVEEMRELAVKYYEEGAPIDHIRHRMDIPRATIRSWLVAAGVELRGRTAKRKLTPAVIRKIETMADEGHTCAEISHETKISSTSVYTALRKLGKNLKDIREELIAQPTSQAIFH